MDSLLHLISGWWLVSAFVNPMPERTQERSIVMLLLLCGSGGLFLFYFIPRWRKEDAEKC